jgi:hypothetical protein
MLTGTNLGLPEPAAFFWSQTGIISGAGGSTAEHLSAERAYWM